MLTYQKRQLRRALLNIAEHAMECSAHIDMDNVVNAQDALEDCALAILKAESLLFPKE